MKILVIVDVQKEFNKFMQRDLVDELYDYARLFKQVYQIWDTHKNDVAPTYVFPNQVDAVKKKYGKNHFSDKVRKFINDKTDETFEGNLFKLSDNEGYIVRVDNNHDWFYVNPEIVELIQKLKDNQVILVGGADNECLEDVYQAFKAFGLYVHINKKYVYSAKTDQNDSIVKNQNNKTLEKINIPIDLTKEQIIKNIQNYKSDYLLIKVDGNYQKQKLLNILNELNGKIDGLFTIADKFTNNDNETDNCYWVIPLKNDKPYKFLTLYSASYSVISQGDLTRIFGGSIVTITDMNYGNKIELVFSQIIGVKLDSYLMYTPKKITKNIDNTYGTVIKKDI